MDNTKLEYFAKLGTVWYMFVLDQILSSCWSYIFKGNCNCNVIQTSQQIRILDFPATRSFPLIRNRKYMSYFEAIVDRFFLNQALLKGITLRNSIQKLHIISRFLNFNSQSREIRTSLMLQAKNRPITKKCFIRIWIQIENTHSVIG